MTKLRKYTVDKYSCDLCGAYTHLLTKYGVCSKCFKENYKKYSVIVEEIKQQEITVYAQSKTEARRAIINKEYTQNEVHDMEDLAPYEDWASNKRIVSVEIGD